mgnify:FL=1
MIDLDLEKAYVNVLVFSEESMSYMDLGEKINGGMELRCDGCSMEDSPNPSHFGNH